MFIDNATAYRQHLEEIHSPFVEKSFEIFEFLRFVNQKRVYNKLAYSSAFNKLLPFDVYQKLILMLFY